jgi:hypothetical protein
MSTPAGKVFDKDPHVLAAQQYGASSSDISLLRTFKQRVAEFQTARGELQRIGAAIARTNDMEAWKQYGELVARSEAIESKVSAAMRALDASLAAVRAAVGLDGLRALSSLGLVWLIPVAVIAAALAVLGYWLSDFVKFRQRYTEQQRVAQELVSQGVDPIEAQRQAAEVVASAAPPAFGESIAGALKFAAILGVVFFAWRQWGRG